MNKILASTLALGLICALTASGVTPVAQAITPEEQWIVVDGGLGPIGIIIIIDGPLLDGPAIVTDGLFGEPGGGSNPPSQEGDPVKAQTYEELPG